MVHMNDIPYEILSNIFSFVDHSQLNYSSFIALPPDSNCQLARSCSLVCRDWKDFGQALLWKSVKLERRRKIPEMWKFNNHLMEYPHLGKFVKTLSLGGFQDRTEDEYYDGKFEDGVYKDEYKPCEGLDTESELSGGEYRFIVPVIQNCINLKDLRLCQSLARPTNFFYILNLLKGRTKLVSLGLEEDYVAQKDRGPKLLGYEITLEEDITSPLAAHTDLDSLDIDLYERKDHSKEHSYLRLRNSKTTENLTYLKWIPLFFSTINHVSLRNLKLLLPPKGFHFLPKFSLPHLKHLYLACSPNNLAEEEILVQSLIAFLPLYPQLETLMISVYLKSSNDCNLIQLFQSIPSSVEVLKMYISDLNDPALLSFWKRNQCPKLKFLWVNNVNIIPIFELHYSRDS